MPSVTRNPLVVVWAVVTSITLTSALIAVDGGSAHRINAVVTSAVLLIAAVKAHLVIHYFMEVRRAPIWLKTTMNAWVVLVFALLLGFYYAGL